MQNRPRGRGRRVKSGIRNMGFAEVEVGRESSRSWHSSHRYYVVAERYSSEPATTARKSETYPSNVASSLANTVMA